MGQPCLVKVVDFKHLMQQGTLHWLLCHYVGWKDCWNSCVCWGWHLDYL